MFSFDESKKWSENVRDQFRSIRDLETRVKRTISPPKKDVNKRKQQEKTSSCTLRSRSLRIMSSLDSSQGTRGKIFSEKTPLKRYSKTWRSQVRPKKTEHIQKRNNEKAEDPSEIS